ncbi:GNAT family N-acetyltransferase [Jeotgalibacillus malaysiensis]|uniref:GNAT family N-acetyltransferase n=1 Tax=Jeotgalibacillus malaysiensis TaxID=1508404 RepID=UPI00384CB8EE
MNISIEPLQASDTLSLLQFEKENRAYFSSMVPDRGDHYFRPEIFAQHHQALLDEQAAGDGLFFLIKGEGNNIVGRINVTDLTYEEHSGSVGYRIAQAYAGKEVASKALELLIHDMRKRGLKKLTAQTTDQHIASQKVLLKNGFVIDMTTSEDVQLNGQT